MKKRRWLWLLAALVALSVMLVVGCQWLIVSTAAGRMYDDVTAVPDQRVALLLGCSKTLANGGPNFFFKKRIAAAGELYKAGMIKAFIVSGDNHRQGYDEPSDMKQALIEAGVPEAKIICDYAGFRTLDSVARAKKVFGQDRILIISQRFHNERALYLAKGWGMDAIAFDAREVQIDHALKTYIREVFARVKAVLDLHLLHTQPKFLGPPVKLPE